MSVLSKAVLNIALYDRLSVSVSTSAPETAITPSTTARADDSMRSLCDSRLFIVALTITTLPRRGWAPVRAVAGGVKMLEPIQDLLGGRLLDLPDDAAVREEQHPVGVRGSLRVVGDHHDRLSMVANRVAEEAEDLRA